MQGTSSGLLGDWWWVGVFGGLQGAIGGLGCVLWVGKSGVRPGSEVESKTFTCAINVSSPLGSEVWVCIHITHMGTQAQAQ